MCAAAVTAGVLSLPAPARADDPACAVRTATSPVVFSARGPVDFGPGFTGSVGGSALGADYNVLLSGDYDWVMPGELRLRWPPSMLVTAVGTPDMGRLTVQYGLRLVLTLRLLGASVPLPLPMWVGMADRSERGMRMFTPWAWQGTDTAVTVTASERLLREGDVMVPVAGLVHYRVWVSYDLTTTVRTREISFPQAMSAITEMRPEAEVAPTANGDMNLPATWNGSLRYVGSLRPRVEVSYNVCLGGFCTRRTDTAINQAIPFASAMEQQISQDQTIRLTLPGATTMPDYRVDLGRVQLGRQGREVIRLGNPGRQTVLFTPTAPTETAFEVSTDPLCVAGGATRELSVRFTPTRVGTFESDFLLATSSPSMPTVMLRLVGEAYDPLSGRDAGANPGTDAGVVRRDASPGDDAGTADPDAGVVDTDAGGGEIYEESPAGCGCRVGEGAAPAGDRGWVAGLGALAVALLRRRRR